MNETVAIISMRIKLDEAEGSLNICLPHLALEPISQQLSTKFLYQTDLHRETESAHDDIQKRIGKTPLDISASFNEIHASMREVLNLQPGDVISLDHHISQPIILRVRHLPKFKADIGIKDNRYAAKITDIIHKEESVDE
jgi:flagellar motor switch protein FliM